MESEPPLSELFSFVLLFPLQFGMVVVPMILLLIVLLMGSALISGSEVAFFSLSKSILKELEEAGTLVGKRIVYLRSYPKRLLATILIVNNLINIAIVILSADVIQEFLPDETFLSWGESLAQNTFLGEWISAIQLTNTLEFIITVAAATFLLVLFGEVTPKIYAKLNNLSLSKFLAFPLLLLFKLFRPFSNLLVNWSDRIESKFQQAGGQSMGKKEDIDRAIDLSVSGDTASQVEADILKGIVKFNDVAVKQIMRSRVDVVAVDRTTTNFTDLMTLIKESGYSRIPVYEEDFDNVKGILYVKDLIGYLEAEESFDWQSLLRENILYVPESKKINELLKEFQTERLHMAIVVDEYGGSSGIVTLEDVMEEVIGEIKDEFDVDQEQEYRKIDDKNYIFEGKTLLNDVCRIIGEDTNYFDRLRGDADSLAGLILEIQGKIPPIGTVIELDEQHFLTVQSITKRRISKIKLSLE